MLFFCFLEKAAQPVQSTSVDPSGELPVGRGTYWGRGSAASWLEGFVPDIEPPSTAQQLPASTHSLITSLHLGPCLTESRDTGCQA